MVPVHNLLGVVPVKLQFPCAYADEKVIAGSGEDIEGFEWDGWGAVMSQVFSKQLWKQTLSKVIQVREWSAADAFVVLPFEGYFLL